MHTNWKKNKLSVVEIVLYLIFVSVILALIWLT